MRSLFGVAEALLTGRGQELPTHTDRRHSEKPERCYDLIEAYASKPMMSASHKIVSGVTSG